MHDFRSQTKPENVEIAYHGTSKTNILSIADLGFIEPGDEGYVMAHGNVYGPGIYVTPELTQACRYGAAILVVAILQGVTTPARRASRANQTPLESDSVTTGSIVVLKKSSQVVSLFWIELAQNTHLSFKKRAPTRKPQPKQQYPPNTIVGKINFGNLSLHNIPLADFMVEYEKYVPMALNLTEMFSKVSLPMAVHLTKRAHVKNPNDPWNWLVNFTIDFPGDKDENSDLVMTEYADTEIPPELLYGSNVPELDESSLLDIAIAESLELSAQNDPWISGW